METILLKIDQRLDDIENMLLSKKDVLTFDEAATYMGVSKSHLYKETCNGTIPYYKPRGKMIYFDRVELEKSLLQNRVTPSDEIDTKAQTYVALKNRRAGK